MTATATTTPEPSLIPPDEVHDDEGAAEQPDYSVLVDAALSGAVLDCLEDMDDAALLALAILDQAGYSAATTDRVADALRVPRLKQA